MDEFADEFCVLIVGVYTVCVRDAGGLPENNLCKCRVAFSMCFQLNYLLEFLSSTQTHATAFALVCSTSSSSREQCIFDEMGNERKYFSFSRKENCNGLC